MAIGINHSPKNRHRHSAKNRSKPCKIKAQNSSCPACRTAVFDFIGPLEVHGEFSTAGPGDRPRDAHGAGVILQWRNADWQRAFLVWRWRFLDVPKFLGTSTSADGKGWEGVGRDGRLPLSCIFSRDFCACRGQIQTRNEAISAGAKIIQN